MLSDKMQEALNRQTNWEIYSAYLYLSMSAYFLSLSLKGFASWMRVQTQEELAHVMKFYDHINDRGGRIALGPVGGPPTEWASPLAAFEAAYQHEQGVTGRINDLVNLALEGKDHSTSVFLQWFVTEQVEEEASVNDVAQQLRLIGDDRGGLSPLDRELGQRVFTMPAGGPAAT